MLITAKTWAVVPPKRRRGKLRAAKTPTPGAAAAGGRNRHRANWRRSSLLKVEMSRPPPPLQQQQQPQRRRRQQQQQQQQQQQTHLSWHAHKRKPNCTGLGTAILPFIAEVYLRKCTSIIYAVVLLQRVWMLRVPCYISYMTGVTSPQPKLTHS